MKLLYTSFILGVLFGCSSIINQGKSNNLIIDEINIDESNLKGEFTLLIQGKEKKTKITIQTTTETQIKKLLKKFSLTEVVEIVHRLTSISKKEIYKKALQLKK